MSTSSTAASSGTVQLHRVLTSTPVKIWRAFTQPDAFARWLPPNSHNFQRQSPSKPTGDFPTSKG